MDNIEELIKNHLIDAFKPTILSIKNESHMHNVPVNAETHFKITIVSDSFKDIKVLNRHKLIYNSLDSVMTSIHALSIYAFDKQEYKNNPIILDSPNCANK